MHRRGRDCLNLLFIPELNWGLALYTFPAYRVLEFIVGMCLGVAFRMGWRPRITPAVGTTAAAGMFIGLEVVVAGFGQGIAPALAGIIMLPSVAALILAFACSDLAGSRSLAGSDLLVRLGKWSFALYLVHELVLRLAAGFSIGEFWFRCALSSIAIIVSIGLSGLLHNRIEHPAEKWLRDKVHVPVKMARGLTIG